MLHACNATATSGPHLAGLRQARPHGVDVGSQPFELLEMGGGQGRQASGSGSREPHMHDAVIVAIVLSAHEPRALGPVDELDHGVVAQQQVVGQVADGGQTFVAAHCEQQLVLGWGQPGGLRLVFAPAEEPAQAIAEAEETSVLDIVKMHAYIVSR